MLRSLQPFLWYIFGRGNIRSTSRIIQGKYGIPWLLPLEAVSPSPEQQRQRTSSVVGSLGGFLPAFGKGLEKVSWWGTEVGHIGETLQLHNVGSSIFSIDIPSQGCWHPNSQIPCQFSWEPPRLHPPRPRPQQLQLPVSGWWLARFDVLTIQNVNVARLQL